MRTTVAVADVIYDSNPTSLPPLRPGPAPRLLALLPSTIRCLIILIILLYYFFQVSEMNPV